MAALALAQMVFTWRAVAQSAGHLGPIAIGMTSRQVTAQMGGLKPENLFPGQWHFSDGGRMLRVHFNAADRVTEIACSEAGLGSIPCPEVLGLLIGQGEPQLLQGLGQGQFSRHATETARSYPGMGLTVVVRADRIAEFRISAAAADASIWPTVLWRLVP